MSTTNDHKISSLYNKLTTLKQPELNAAVKNVHRVILTLCRLDPTYFIGIDAAIAITKKFLSKLSDDAIIGYINTPALLQLFHSRYHKDIKTLLLTISNLFPFLLGFYDHIMYALNYLDTETNDQKTKENLFFIIQLIKEFGDLSTEDKVYILKRLIMFLNQSTGLISELSKFMPIFDMSKEVTTDVCQYLSTNKDILNDIVIKIESVGIDTLLEKSIISLDALVNIVENSKGSVMSRDSRDSVSPAIVTPDNSPQNSPKNSPKASGKKSFWGSGKRKPRKTRKNNKRTKKMKPKRKTRK
uniref:Uncharacterized protein n=1 Tax=viral metagenome TaxID=1070528 RepID=A0A6C0E5V7_9ZZZZ